MIARILILILIVTLAIPVTTLTGPGGTTPSPWGESAMAAKGKKHKKKDRKPRTRTVIRSVRQPVTRTFTSAQLITVPNGAPGTTKGPAALYPSTIAVSGFTNGVITDVDLILSDVTHAHASDLDILLSAGDGRRALVMSDRGVGEQVINLDLTLDDEAAAELPETDLASGTFRPSNVGSNDDTFAAPAPAPDGNVALSTFDGANPNRTWQLWVMDDLSGDVGAIEGWALQITAEADVQVEEQATGGKDKKKGKQHKKGKGR